VDHEISPEPDEAEREAILAALAAEEEERQPLSPWVQELLPERGEEEDRP
jgi:hypothetical protein